MNIIDAGTSIANAQKAFDTKLSPTVEASAIESFGHR
jgi:hypothetical protein